MSLTTTAPLCALMVAVFERHGRTGSNDLPTLRPIGGTERFRDGLRVYPAFAVLWYEQRLPSGQYTSRMVRAAV